MDTQQQFWWNWVVNVGVALGTLGAVFAALFGDILRSKWFPPCLQLTLPHPEGHKTQIKWPVKTETGMEQRAEDVRYYHLRVSNTRRWSPAREVQVFLTRVEEPGPDNALQVVWSGDIPVYWDHQELFPPARTIGPAADCVLCSVLKGGALVLHPLVVPFNMKTRWEKSCTVITSFQARSSQADSDNIRVQIAWDGHWEDGEAEMKRHLVVKMLGSHVA